MPHKIIASFFKPENPQAQAEKIAPVTSLYHYVRKWWQIAAAAACITIFIISKYFWPVHVKNNNISKSVNFLSFFIWMQWSNVHFKIGWGKNNRYAVAF